MSKDWSDKLRQKMDAHEESPPNDLWNNIELLMEQEKLSAPIIKSRKILLWRFGAVAAILVIALLVGLNLTDTAQYTENQIAEIQKVENEQNGKSSQNILINQSIENSLLTAEVHHNKKSKKSMTSLNPLQSQSITEADSLQRTRTHNNKAEQQADSNVDDSNEPKITKKDLVDNRKNDVGPQRESDLIKQTQITKNSRWSTKLYASNLPLASNTTENGYNSLSTQDASSVCNAPSLGLGADDPLLGQIYESNKYDAVFSDIKHKQPITLGVSVDYKIDNKWSVSSGVNYTKLSSTSKSGTANNYYSSEQDLYYIGIPLNVNYSIFRNKNWNLYSSTGFGVAKNISGNIKTSYILNNKFESESEKSISIADLQFSVGEAIGVQYNLSDVVGLYAEPGVSYYFKNQNKVKTIYTDRPFDFKLNFGLRFSLGI